MAFFQEIRGRVGATWVVFILGLILVYFSYHLLAGDHGWIGFQKLKEDLVATDHNLEVLSDKEEKLLYKINMLKTPIDPDLLEELAGKRLEYFPPEHKVLLTEGQQSS